MPVRNRKLGAAIAIVMIAVGTSYAHAQNGASDTYPEEALRLGQEGRVITHLVINESGSVKSCTIVETSGSPSLDADACDKLLKRAHFSPARDVQGNAIEGDATIPVRYVLPKK